MTTRYNLTRTLLRDQSLAANCIEYVLVLLSLWFPLQTIAQDDLALDVTGMWQREDGSLIRIMQEGQAVRGVFVELHPELIDVYGFAPNDEHMVAGIEGKKIRGKMHAHYPVVKKEKCPSIWASLREVELTLSEDENVLEGRWRMATVDFNTCRVTSEQWKPRKYVRHQPSVAKGKGKLEVRTGTGDSLVTPEFELVFDASGSMWESVGGEPKITVAKKIMADVIEDLPADARVALRIYGHRVSPEKRSEACKDTELVSPLGTLDKQELLGRLRDIQPKGTTPIAYSLRQVANDFDQNRGDKKMVILVTDGKEECNESPLEAVAELQAAGLNVVVNVIGFALASADTKHDMRRVAAVTGGRFYDAQDAAGLADAISETLSVPYRVLSKDRRKVRGGFVGAGPVELAEGVYTVQIELVDDSLNLPSIQVARGQTTTIVLEKRGSTVMKQIRGPE